MSYDENVYYNPEKYGLTVVAEIEYSSGSYEFDTRVVWKHTDGRLFTARDAGCSCPTPFEDYNSLEELERVDVKVLEDEIREQRAGYAGEYVTVEMVDAFLTAVREAMSVRPSK